jgi:hypothetical protein
LLLQFDVEHGAVHGLDRPATELEEVHSSCPCLRVVRPQEWRRQLTEQLGLTINGEADGSEVPRLETLVHEPLCLGRDDTCFWGEYFWLPHGSDHPDIEQLIELGLG